MIPVKLTLSNFTSYGDLVPELDFRKFHMGAISGSNGAGKSSLLDAITWCLWGWSRVGDSSDQLVRLGASNMYIEFSFELDGNAYTVKRSRSLVRGGSSALELWSGSNNLTEGTIKVTQQKIIDLLHLSFETFTNSSFLRQGHADEFTTKGPTDRKRILADILGLAHYDKLEASAKEKVKTIDNNLKLLEYQLLEIEAELISKEEREKSLSLAEKEAEDVEKKLKEVEGEIKVIQNEHQTISQTINLLEERKTQIDATVKELADIRLQIELKEKAQNEFQEILKQKEEIKKNYAKLQSLEEDKKKLEDKRSELLKAKDELANLQKIIISLEDRRSKKCNLLELDIKKLETENEQLETQNDHLSKHKDTCPTCGQAIEEITNRQIINQNQKKLSENNTQLKKAREELKVCQEFELKEQKEIDAKDIEVKKLEKELDSWSEINLSIESLEKYLDLYNKLTSAETGVKTHAEAVLDLQKMYKTREEQIVKSQKELEQLVSFESKLQVVRSKLTAQETIKQELSKKALELRGTVGEARQLVTRAKQLEELLNKKVREKSSLQKEKEAFDELALAFGKRGIQAMIIETAIPEIEEEANNLLARLTDGRMKIELRTQRETKTKQEDGEKAVVETLDIIISDEMGDRPYENYSGGEQFRVNMAIRLALSKLLTRRAGAKLQFLVIDEGFGTQDVEGRAKIVEVLDTIKDDFEKILIITHLDELKEEFPVRIEVSKNTTGSTFEVTGV